MVTLGDGRRIVTATTAELVADHAADGQGDGCSQDDVVRPPMEEGAQQVRCQRDKLAEGGMAEIFLAADTVARKDVRPGDSVYVRRAGDVIPAVVERIEVKARMRNVEALVADGIPVDDHEITYQADLRYAGQAFQITVPRSPI